MQTPTPQRGRAWVVAAAVAFAAVLTTDRLIKILVVAHPENSRVLLSGWLSLRGTRNAGVAFGLPLPPAALTLAIAVAVVTLVALAVGSWRRGDLYAVVCLLAVVGGAAANVMDRLRYGAVVDYLDVPWFTVFNLADALITLGVAALLARALVRRPTPARRNTLSTKSEYQNKFQAPNPNIETNPKS